MATSVQEMMAAANAAVPRLTPGQVREKLAAGALLLDVRDPNEVAASGKIAGALAVSRGMLEFRADPALPSHLAELRQGVPVLTYCASGGRSALAGKTLLD
ncbi:MAG: rhodanese-like domain-containing protein, partial [Acetobacteraceae bacterium]